jgi:hypothetical protein
LIAAITLSIKAIVVEILCVEGEGEVV